MFDQFCRDHPGNEFGFGADTPDSERDGKLWDAYSAETLARQRAERSELADRLEAEQRGESQPAVSGAEEAVARVAEMIETRGIDYPTDSLTAERFETGWSVFAPVEVDDSDPMAFLDIPVGRSIFLVGDSGRIVEVSSSIPPQQARALFNEEERANEARRDPE
ncbi:hypothetical protein [Nocardia nova]|uniref:hypothetical protein n=1 Tax=Nocardia nova TaxID=37330 RepID=UPI0033E16911